MAVSLTRVVTFRASHRLHRADWTEERNREAFGALGAAPGHPHDYQCAVTVTGPAHPPMAMVLDLPLLDRILDDEVVRAFHGKNFNRDVPAFADGMTIPTCEAIAALVFANVAARLPVGVVLERVRILEDPTLYADCTGLP
ncbi:MAG TPA: 6-carboxytetrahydropterin synthase [Gemmatimonadales bacterium]|jgi:6-pyruvoyltetrahydropterin/6-carboxytetrahydropterin synthase